MRVTGTATTTDDNDTTLAGEVASESETDPAAATTTATSTPELIDGLTEGICSCGDESCVAEGAPRAAKRFKPVLDLGQMAALDARKNLPPPPAVPTAATTPAEEEAGGASAPYASSFGRFSPHFHQDRVSFGCFGLRRVAVLMCNWQRYHHTHSRGGGEP